MDTSKCVICEADFRKNVIKDGKCPTCLKEHPDVNSREEAMAKVKIPNKMGDELTELRVKEIVGEMLETRFAPILEKLDALAQKRGPGRPKKETK